MPDDIREVHVIGKMTIVFHGVETVEELVVVSDVVIFINRVKWDSPWDDVVESVDGTETIVTGKNIPTSSIGFVTIRFEIFISPVVLGVVEASFRCVTAVAISIFDEFSVVAVTVSWSNRVKFVGALSPPPGESGVESGVVLFGVIPSHFGFDVLFDVNIFTGEISPDIGSLLHGDVFERSH